VVAKLKYRPELDGLRSVAVIPVILYHAGFQVFSGGFVGVDIFFVISGYLITNIIYAEMLEKRFSILKFYERRARRILPALLLVCLACLPFAVRWLTPGELAEFGKSLIAVCLFASNIFFWLKSDYFATASELKPLLHTWSLAIEEQFYIFFPVLLLLLRRFPGKIVFAVIAVLSIISFATAEIGSVRFPEANFYLLPSRAWELGVGALVALGFGGNRISGDGLARSALYSGWMMILGSIFLLNSTMPFPGILALPSVLGTALIIMSAGTPAVGTRILRWQPMVWVGLLSYSAYLWHQPLFAFARTRSLEELTPVHYAGLIALTFLLAWLTMKFVETPFRDRKKTSVKRLAMLASPIAAGIFVAGSAISLSHGLPERKNGLAGQIDADLQRAEGLNEDCSGLTVIRECETGPSDTPTLLVWGDSYAMQLTDGILASEPGAHVVQRTFHSCPPLFDLTPYQPFGEARKGLDWTEKCAAFNASVKVYLETHREVKFVVIGSLFTQFEDATWFIDSSGRTVESDVETIIPRFRETLDWIKARGIRVVVFDPTPSETLDVGRCLARHEWFDSLDADDCQIDLTKGFPSLVKVHDAIMKLAQNYNIFSLRPLLCNGTVCQVRNGNILFYHDIGHLTKEGSRFIGRTADFYEVATGLPHTGPPPK
jgi:peptidoglycan/LPS O-acetylase OafA/YrhL